MFTVMRPGEMEANQLRGKLYRDHFNSWLDGTGLAVMLMESGLFAPKPIKMCLANVEMDAEYVTQFRSWINGAVIHLATRCDAEGQRFTYGSFGSIWLDTTLTGKLVDGTEKTKDVRIGLMPAEHPTLVAKGKAIRVVGYEPRIVKLTKKVHEGVWLVAGEEVPEGDLFAMHKLNDKMQYALVFDPTGDGELVF